MRIIQYPPETTWEEITRRPQMDNATLSATVKNVLDDVRLHGDEAVKRYEERFDHVSLDTLAVSEAEMAEAERLVPAELLESLQLAHDNIHRFHASQQFEEIACTTKPGVRCWQKSVAIERVGLYIPGGTAPLFSTVLMLATPAKIAGCREIVLCTPPNREGKVHPAILMAARIAGVSRIFKAGGVQAIGAMAYGTESIPKVYKIFGPGNQYVMAAKQEVSLHDGPPVASRAWSRLAVGAHHHLAAPDRGGEDRVGQPVGCPAATRHCRAVARQQSDDIGSRHRRGHPPEQCLCP